MPYVSLSNQKYDSMPLQCQELIPLQINYNTDFSWKKTKCQQILNNFYCGCRDGGLSTTDLDLYPEMKQWPVCDGKATQFYSKCICYFAVSKPNIKYCRDQVESSLKENTLSCSCSTEQRYIRVDFSQFCIRNASHLQDVLDLLTLHSVNWNQTGRSSYAISRRYA